PSTLTRNFSKRWNHALAAVAALVAIASLPRVAAAVGEEPYVAFTRAPGSFTLVEERKAARIWVDADDWPGVVRAARDLAADVERVTGIEPDVWHGGTSRSSRMVIVGTLGRSALVDSLVAAGKIDAASIRGKWESYFLETVREPLPG